MKIYKKVKSLLGRPIKLRSLTSSSPLWLAFCFLGATSHSTIRKFSVKDDWYLGWAETWIKGRFIFGLSKCTYGWLAGLRTWTDCSKLWIMTKHAQKVNHMANTWGRALVLGEIISPLSLRSPWRVVSTIYKKRPGHLEISSGHTPWYLV